ncbi:Prolyl 4-hydroxylase, alpha polypeptide [Halocaridina rubra]|uniref:Prolyl 4-hydroxylase, alpha polypeptide n=1 Tax=Halocaridina rubra TaxID=373956 RepID=A0AAN8ZWD5_HALRR
MSNVEAGGRTVFGNAGVSVAPVKGGAAFWYNIDDQGQLDSSSLHAGCPVLLGHKWAANKWIRENANSQKRLCVKNRA